MVVYIWNPQHLYPEHWPFFLMYLLLTNSPGNLQRYCLSQDPLLSVIFSIPSEVFLKPVYLEHFQKALGSRHNIYECHVLISFVNSSTSGDASNRSRPSSMILVMAWCQTGTKPLPKSMMTYRQLNLDYFHFIKCIENGINIIAAIFAETAKS